MTWDETDEARQVITTAKCHQIFGLPLGFHPLIYNVRAIEVALISSQSLFILLDPDKLTLESEIAPHAVTNEEIVHEIDAGRMFGSQMTRKKFHVRSDANDTYVPNHFPTTGPWHLWNMMHLEKATAAVWGQIEFEYRMVPGAMRWDDEWSQLLRQKRNIPKLTTAGRKFHQVGNYHVLRRYNLLS